MAKRPRHEVAEIFNRYLELARREGTEPAWSWAQRGVVGRITACRTARLGGHLNECHDCGHRSEISYNSCRNRHCPKCQGSAQSTWCEARQADVLAVPYAHVVFTMPQTLAPLALQNKKLVYDLLMRTVASTLQEIAQNPKHLGARLGFFAILHTWGQTLVHHPHVHCVVPAGGLAEDGTWRPCRPRFFLPVRVLGRLFRGKFVDGLRNAHRDGRLEFHGALAHRRSRSAFEALLHDSCRTEWVVDARPPFEDPKHVLKYLARYTHRIAISNHRLLRVDDETVTFRYKDYRSRRVRSLQLSLAEFTRRFLLHLLPKGFVRIRHYGFLANGCRARLLPACRRALGQPEQAPVATKSESDSESDPLLGIPSRAIGLCPKCGRGPLRYIEVLARPPPAHRLHRHTHHVAA